MLCRTCLPSTCLENICAPVDPTRKIYRTKMRTVVFYNFVYVHFLLRVTEDRDSRDYLLLMQKIGNFEVNLGVLWTFKRCFIWSIVFSVHFLLWLFAMKANYPHFITWVFPFIWHSGYSVTVTHHHIKPFNLSGPPKHYIQLAVKLPLRNEHTYKTLLRILSFAPS